MSQPDTLHNHALPDELPVGEYMLWQGSPTWQSTALHVFHARKVAIYFALLTLWRFADKLYEGQSALDAATYAVWIVPIAVAGVALLAGLAWLTAKSTIYTITSKRIVFRIGIALSMTVNVPFRIIEAAGLKTFSDGTGDIALKLQADAKAAYAVIWPHARRWHWKHPQPSLRAIPDAAGVADILSEALASLPPVFAAAPVGARPRDVDGPRHPDLAYPTAAE